MKKISILILAGLLTACGGVKEPTEAELKEVVARSVKLTGKHLGQRDMELTSLKKERCKRIDDIKFECSYTFETNKKLGGLREAIFAKRDSGWEVSR